MKKVSKAILIGLAVLVALGIALVVGLNLYIQSPGSQARIQEELSKSLRLPLKLTNVSVSPFGSLSITGITIPNGGANFLDATSFNARYRWLPLLHGRLVITEMEVESPKIVWEQTKDGKWKLPEPEQAKSVSAEDASQTLVKEQEKTEEKKSPAEAEKVAEEKKSSFAVIVQRFNIKGGSVELFDTAKKHVAVFSDVNMTYTSLTADHIEGTATIGKVVWADTLTLENVTTPFKFADGVFNLPEIAATFAGGTLQGKYHTHAEKTRSPFKIAITFAKVDLDRLGAQMGAAAGEAAGMLSGQIEFHGDTAHTDHMEGEGRVDVRDAQFHQLDLFQNIGQILGMRELSDLRVHDGHGELHLAGDKILVDKLTLNTSDLQLTAHGTARLDKRLNLDAQLSAEDAVVQRLPGMIRDNFLPVEGGRRAISFAINGTTDKPKTNIMDKLVGQKINSQFGDVLGAIFGGDSNKKPEEDKSKKEEKKKKKDKDRAAPNAATPPASTPPAATPAPAAPQTQPVAPNP
ncbi:MAG: type II secretion system protein GspN [Chthoniobacter sp.]|uniref:type II secretion system protein GspN n=1 Tax=Chthoniobacter sp. TaxID=2510640 RepID=UPI0032A5610A